MKRNNFNAFGVLDFKNAENNSSCYTFLSKIVVSVCI